MVRRTLVVGPGRAGRSLALAEARAGHHVQLLGRGPGPWMEWARLQGIEPLLGPPETAGLGKARVVLFAVPDGALASAAAEVARALPPRRKRFAAHLSGFHGLEPLRPFECLGHATAALHPILSFGDPDRDLLTLLRARVTVLAPEEAQKDALRVVRSWGARPLLLPPDVDRRRYHLALSLASNHLLALLYEAEELLRPALGEEARDTVVELARQSLEAAGREGPGPALTGPVVRGDAEVVAGHLQALEGAAAARYRALALSLVDLAVASGRLQGEARRRMAEVLAERRRP